MHDSREVTAEEAKSMNLVNYLVRSEEGGQNTVFSKALDLARLLASHPQTCMRTDRSSMLENAYAQDQRALLQREFTYGLDTLNDPSFGRAVQAFITKAKM